MIDNNFSLGKGAPFCGTQYNTEAYPTEDIFFKKTTVFCRITS